MLNNLLCVWFQLNSYLCWKTLLVLIATSAFEDVLQAIYVILQYVCFSRYYCTKEECYFAEIYFISHSIRSVASG